MITGNANQQKAQKTVWVLLWGGLAAVLVGLLIATKGSYYFGVLIAGLGGGALQVGAVAYAVWLAHRASNPR